MIFKMDKIQDQKDLIGKVILSRNDLKRENQKVAVYGFVYDGTPVMKVTDYPINIKSPRVYKLAVMRSQQKQSEKEFEETGDWCFVMHRTKIKELSEKENSLLEEIINQKPSTQ